MATKRIEITVKVEKKFTYTKSYGWQDTDMALYKMVDEDGKIYVWNTSSRLGMDVEVPWESECGYLIDTEKHKKWDWVGAHEGDTVKITAAVKGERTYKGEKQTELQRVKLVEILVSAEDLKAKKEAEKAAKKQAQLDSVKGEDFIWEMPYSQFKAHYADCETVIDSYAEHVDRWGFVKAAPTIKVIIRAGRLKKNGTRGGHYAGYRIRFELDGQSYVEPFRAICERTAMQQAKEKYPKATGLELVEIIHYRKAGEM